jgi:hypothetical protein
MPTARSTSRTKRAQADPLEFFLSSYSVERTREGYKSAFNSYARFRQAPSPNASFLQLLSMSLIRFEAELRDLREYLTSVVKMSPLTAGRYLLTIRRFVRKAKDAGFTDLELAPPIALLPRQPYDRLDGILGCALNGLGRTLRKEYVRTFKAYVRFRKAESIDSALIAFSKLDRGESLTEMERFRTYLLEVERLSPTTVRVRLAGMRTAVRKLRKAGLTDLNIDLPSRRPNFFSERGERLSEAIKGLGQARTKVFLRALAKLARFLDASSIEDGLMMFFAMKQSHAHDALDRLYDQEQGKGVNRTSLEQEFSAIRIAVQRCNIARYTDLYINSPLGRPISTPDALLTVSTNNPKHEVRNLVCSVTFDAEGVPYVFGKKKAPLKATRRKIVEALIEAGPEGLSIEELTSKSQSGGARKTMNAMREEDDDWKAALILPGKRGGGGYRLAHANAKRSGGSRPGLISKGTD